MSSPPVPASGQFDGPVHRYAVRVYYEDTDAGQVVYHANYLKWFERARSDMLDLFGIDQRAASEAGAGSYVVAEVALKFRASARLGDVVVIETACEEIGAATLQLRQRALRGADRLVESQVRVAFVGPDGKPRRQPADWLDKFASLVETPAAGNEGPR